MNKLILFTLILMLFSFILLANERGGYVELFRNIYEVENDEFDELFEFWADVITFANNSDSEHEVFRQERDEFFATYSEEEQQRLRYLEWLINQKHPYDSARIRDPNWNLIAYPHPIKRSSIRRLPAFSDYFNQTNSSMLASG